MKNFLNLAFLKIKTEMKREEFLLLYFISLILLPFISFGQKDTEKDNKNLVQLAPGIMWHSVGGGAIVVSSTGKDGVLLVDAGYEKTGDSILNDLALDGTGSLKFILNTHWHSDHTGGNKVLGQNATIIAHDYVKTLLEAEQQMFGKTRPAYPLNARPDITFSDRLTLDFNDENIQMIHLPGGHTAGDAIVYFTKSGIVALGDVVFADRFPFVDMEHGGNAVKYIENLFWITENFSPDVIFVPGHGRTYSMEDLKLYASTLKQTLEVIQNAIQNGVSLDDMKQQGLLKDWKSFGQGWINEDSWAETCYRSITHR